MAAEASAGLKEVLKRSERELFKDGNTLTFICKVTADGSVHESVAVVFPMLALTERLSLDDLTPFTAIAGTLQCSRRQGLL